MLDTGMTIVLDLIERIDPAGHFDVLGRAIGACDAAVHIHAWRDVRLDPGDVEQLTAVEFQAPSSGATLEFEGEHTHAD